MGTPFITIIDYGAGNIHSLVGAFRAVGANCCVEDEANRLMGNRTLVLPGVGSFKSAMARLDKTGMSDALREAASLGSRILGICLGMQLLGEWSDEEGGSTGLGLVPGRCQRFMQVASKPVKIPHTGFNSVTADEHGTLFRGVPRDGDFYFAHSYRMVLEGTGEQTSLATTQHGDSFTSAYEIDKQIFGVQFHPELSQGNGLQLLSNFVSSASC